MRILSYLIAILVLLPSVFAVGVGVPDNLEEEVELEEGEEITYEFLLRGDASERDVNFFIFPVTNGVITVEGKGTFSKNYNLDPYEDVLIEIDIEGISGGETVVEWGFTYLPNASEDFAVEQTIQQSFSVEVEGFTYNNDNDDSSSSSSGGGGGGGGAYIPPDIESEAEERRARALERSQGDVLLDDISASGSATNQIVAEETPVARVQPSLGGLGGTGNEVLTTTDGGGTGKTALLVMMMMFVFTAGLSFASYKAVKGEDNE
jgi:hypothetical protein